MKHSVLLFCALLATLFSFSQVSIGVKGGFVLSHFTRLPSFDYSDDNQVLKTGFQAGVAVGLPLSKKLTLQAELLYTVKGLRDTTYVYSVMPTGNGYPYYRGYGYNFNYLELPVLLKVPFASGFHLGVGPSVAYLLRADKVLDGKAVADATSTLSKWDYALNGDLSYRYRFLEVGVRYTHGLASVRNLGNPDPERFAPARALGKNRSAQVYLGFNLKY